jgi:hypothetical protein
MNGHHVASTWTVRIKVSKNDYLNLSREVDTPAPPIVAGFTDAVGKILCSKAPEMLGTHPIQEIAITVGQVQLANGVRKPVQPATALIQNTSSGLIMPSEENQLCQD